MARFLAPPPPPPLILTEETRWSLAPLSTWACVRRSPFLSVTSSACTILVDRSKRGKAERACPKHLCAPVLSSGVNRSGHGAAEPNEALAQGSVSFSDDEDDNLEKVLQIVTREDKFRYHKVPELKALKLKLEPSLVLRVLKSKLVKPSNKWKFFVWAKKQMNYRHTQETYNSIIVTLLEIRKFTSIYFLLEDMYESEVQLTPRTCLRMARSYGRAGMAERAFHALNHMTRLGSPATTRNLNAVVAELLEKGRNEYKAYITYRELAKVGCEPDGHTFKLLFRELARLEKVDLACHVFDDMKARGCEPDVETASSLVTILCRAGRVEDGFQVFENVKRRGVRFNFKVYDSLLLGLGRTGHWARALQVWDEMRLHGFHPSVSSATAIDDLLTAAYPQTPDHSFRENMRQRTLVTSEVESLVDTPLEIAENIA